MRDAPLVLDAGARQFGFARGPRDARFLDRLLGPPERFGGRGPLRADAVRLEPRVVRFDVELRQRLAYTVPCGGRVLERVAQRRCGVDRREHLAPRRFDVGFEPFDLAVRRIVRLRAGREHRRRAVTLGVGVGRRHPPRLERGTRRLTARLERRRLGHDGGRRARRAPSTCSSSNAICCCWRLMVSSQAWAASRVEVDFDSASTSSMRSRLRLDSTSATCAAAADSRTRASESCARADCDRLGQLPILARQEDFLAAAQLVAKLLVALRLAGLPLQRPALLFDLEHDVVDAGQVLPRGFELELRRAAAGLVPGDAGRFFDQLAAIGRPRAQNEANLALLDDGVRLRAEARVHQQFVHVAQAADLAVDQILALSRSVETPRHFHFARDRLDQFLGLGTRENRILTRDAGRDEGNRFVAVAVRPVPIRPVAVMAVAVVTVAVGRAPWPFSCGTPSSIPGSAGPDRFFSTPLKRSRTSADAVGFRASLPLKSTSSIRSPRRLLALCSPITHVMASATLLLPQPFGPTMAVTPLSKASSERSENDLNPLISRRSRRMVYTTASTRMPAMCGNAGWVTD